MSTLVATLEPVRFGEFLRDRSLITDEQWLAALAEHWCALAFGPSDARSKRNRRIGNTIVDLRFLPADVVEAEARVFHDDLDVVEVVPRSERATLPIPFA